MAIDIASIVIISLIILFIVTIIAIMVLSISYSASSSTNNNFLPPCTQSVDYSSLIDLTQTSLATPCNNDSGFSLYYIPSMDITVSTWYTPYHLVCVRYCNSYINNVCNGDSDSYNTCMSRLGTLSPQCQPPTPIGRYGTILYYPYSPSNIICQPNT